MAPLTPVIGWSSAFLLVVLFARAVARLLTDRGPRAAGVCTCGRATNVAELTHAAMALGMAVMVIPVRLPTGLLAAYFGVNTAAVAGVWVTRVAVRRGVLRRGDTSARPPVHALEPHHVIVGLAMVAMAVQPAGAVGMPGMVAMGGAARGISMLSLVYVWVAVVMLGMGMARAASGPLPAAGAAQALKAPVVVYSCELVMTVVMGLMLLG